MRRSFCIGLLAILVVALADIGAASGSPKKPAACPVPDSGTCGGKLAAGADTTESFRPALTFTVPAGWVNYLDIGGLYLLQPPGSKPPGNTISGSFIGLETSVAPEAFNCRSPVSGVGRSPAAITAWIAKQHGLIISNRRAAFLGGLRGIALDIRMAHGAKGCLSMGATTPAVPLLVGVGPSSFDHEVAPGFVERHFLLAYKGGTLDVQVDDSSGGKHLAAYTAIVNTFRFAH